MPYRGVAETSDGRIRRSGCAQVFLGGRFTLTGCGVRSSCANRLTRSSSSSQRNSSRRASATPLALRHAGAQ